MIERDVPDNYIPPTTRRTMGVQSQKEIADKAYRRLPPDASARKGIPITTGVMDYFPLALAEVARVSVIGNNQHNPGEPLHWAKEKSRDHADCIARHLIERGGVDTDGARHSAKLAWRALALLQIELEDEAALEAWEAAVKADTPMNYEPGKIVVTATPHEALKRLKAIDQDMPF